MRRKTPSPEALRILKILQTAPPSTLSSAQVRYLVGYITGLLVCEQQWNRQEGYYYELPETVRAVMRLEGLDD